MCIKQIIRTPKQYYLARRVANNRNRSPNFLIFYSFVPVSHNTIF